MTLVGTTDHVLTREQAFFDAEAAGMSDRDLIADLTQVRRYQQAELRARNIPKDTLFARLRPLTGKRVLDYGCGTGQDSCHLASCGGQVTAFDLSPGSIVVARRRAELNGVADRIQFDVRTAGQTGYVPGSFDVVVGFAILHHLHDHLPAIYSEISSLLVPGGKAYFIEPVANSPLLRGLRRVIPVATNATPDERQLQYADFNLMRSYGFARLEYDHFHFLARLNRGIGAWGGPALRRTDHYLLRAFPFLRRLYGAVLVTATKG